MTVLAASVATTIRRGVGVSGDDRGGRGGRIDEREAPEEEEEEEEAAATGGTTTTLFFDVDAAGAGAIRAKAGGGAVRFPTRLAPPNRSSRKRRSCWSQRRGLAA